MNCSATLTTKHRAHMTLNTSRSFFPQTAHSQTVTPLLRLTNLYYQPISVLLNIKEQLPFKKPKGGGGVWSCYWMTAVQTLGARKNTVASLAWSVDFPSVSCATAFIVSQITKMGIRTLLPLGSYDPYMASAAALRTVIKMVLIKIQSSFKFVDWLNYLNSCPLSSWPANRESSPAVPIRKNLWLHDTSESKVLLIAGRQ